MQDNGISGLSFKFDRETRAVLFLDVVESVRLMDEDEEGIVTRWSRFGNVILDLTHHQYKGTDHDTGDGFLLVFDDARAAVAAALKIQTLSRDENAAYAPDKQLLLRIGIEYSDVIIEGSNVRGKAVNRAQRIMTLASPGEIVVTANVRDHLAPGLDADIEDLGDCFLRHFKKPVRAFRVGPANPRQFAFKPLVELDLNPTIAVIPFFPLSGVSSKNMVGQIVAEEIIRMLSHSMDLKVISRLSTAAFAGRNFSLDDISAHLGANYVLSGTYRCSGDKIILDTEFSETRSRQVLWSERIEDSVSGLLNEGQELIYRIVSQIEVAIMAREVQRAKASPLPNLEAYTLLMAAITLMYRLSISDFEDSRRFLEALIGRATLQAIPQAWLANWHVLRVQQGWSRDPKADTYLALEGTKKALDVDPECSLALAINGFANANLARRLDIAQQSYDLALKANPNNSLAWLLKGTMHAFRDEGEQAVTDTQLALKLSPVDPHLYFYQSLAASAFLTAKQYAKALETAMKSYRANRTHTSTLRVITVAHWKLRQYKQARQMAAELMRLEPDLTISGYLGRMPSADYKIGQDVARTLHKAGVPM